VKKITNARSAERRKSTPRALQHGLDFLGAMVQKKIASSLSDTIEGINSRATIRPNSLSLPLYQKSSLNAEKPLAQGDERCA